MPVTFADQPSPKARRASASAPFPGRVMTSLVPADVPRKKRTSSSGSRGRGSVSSIASGYGTAGPGPIPENPFADDSGVTRAGTSGISVGQEYERMTPANAPAIAVYNDAGDAERQPLLGDEEDERLEVPWAFTLAIAGAIGVATFVILYIWRAAEEEGTLARS